MKNIFSVFRCQLFLDLLYMENVLWPLHYFLLNTAIEKKKNRNIYCLKIQVPLGHTVFLCSVLFCSQCYQENTASYHGPFTEKKSVKWVFRTHRCTHWRKIYTVIIVYMLYHGLHVEVCAVYNVCEYPSKDTKGREVYFAMSPLTNNTSWSSSGHVKAVLRITPQPQSFILNEKTWKL